MSRRIRKISAKGVRWLIWSIYVIMIITIIVTWVFYPVRYDFWDLTTSTLGGISPANHPEMDNVPSMIIFSSGFVLLGGVAIFTGIVYFKNKDRFRFAIIKGINLVIMGIGALGIAIPHDINPITITHVVGAYLFLSSMAILNFVLQLLHCMEKYTPNPDKTRDLDFYVDYTFVVLLIITAVLYFATEIFYKFIPNLIWIPPAPAQKILLFTGIIAAGLLDLDDIK